MDDFVGTLSDNDVSDEERSVSDIAEVAPVNGTKRKREVKSHGPVKKQRRDDQNGDADGDIDSDFEFGLDNTTALEDYEALLGDREVRRVVDVEDIVARRRVPQDEEPEHSELEDDENIDGISEGSFGGFGAGAGSEQDDEQGSSRSDNSDEDVDDDGEEEDEDDEAAPVPHPDDMAADSDVEEPEDAIEIEKENAFFATASEPANGSSKHSFQSLSLSRPIMKGLASIGFNTPTPIQSKTIPVALEGKDVVGGAVTGSGKTAAFVIPILERLMYRPRRTATTRVAILAPTRELALQCYNVAKKLASFTDITFGQAIGGLNSREQEKQLKLRPDIVIATPGRFIDLERNSPSFSVNTVEILVLDEADRMLEEGFADELNEILSKIPKSRQTMLFSATMTSKVDDLIRVGLQRPVRLLVDAQKSTVEGLVQEFVRLRAGRETKRLGCLMYLCTTIHTDRVIIFFRQKKEAHRVRVIFALFGLKAAELHGSLSQEQRIQAIESFRSGRASFLLATDLASRGLDIKGIETVINYEAPQSHEIYLHRVGRTARAGRTGRACTLAAEPDRKIVKAAVKSAKAQGAVIRQRTVEMKDADAWQAKCDDMDDEVEQVLREEKEERLLASTEREITKADNVVTHRDEIMARPKKTWFESEADKKTAKDKGRVVLNGPEVVADGAKQKKGKGKLSNKQKKKLQDKDDREAGMVWNKGKSRAERERGGKPAQPGKVKPKSKSKPRVKVKSKR